MKKAIIIILSFITIIAILVGGCSIVSNVKKKEKMEIALPISVKYIKEHYNADFVMTDYDVLPDYIHSIIFIDGYIKGHEDEHISITYNYKKYEVINVLGPGWFIDSEIAAKEVPSP
ncbi:hypothetical protein [Paenibacillus glacialis]|uniref:DUF3139 domain-containing protein n=1 Tax=Paenibacillus glacialis TaxID=494026 RepID=A0A162K8P8_9BACL|nr:hypothetical protein [Paenibacillus glacialis]OAB42278.1 hypothetical protein PGLA_13330 [Paenibacillus glacialis]